MVQELEFSGDWTLLIQNKTLLNKSKILALNQFMDTNNNLIRIAGRLKNSTLCDDVKYPILLPKNSVLTKLLIREEDERILHADPQATIR